MHRNAFTTKGEGYSFGRVLSAGFLCVLLLAGQTAPLLGNPTGGAVVAGSATIGAAGSTLSINQSTQNAIINWQQFSIASGETTKFIVPNSGATLNRVTGGNPSAIYGNLQSNGTLYLVNPSGIVVGPSGRIDTAGFLASTLDVSNQQFMAGGNLEFAGSSDAAVENDGVIHASSGDVYLIAHQVDNKGQLNAPQGTVGLAAGNDVLFQQAGSQHLFVQATPAHATRALGVTNSGTIRAAAAELKAAGGNAYALAINNTGVIAATGYKKINGQVYLTSDGGSISNRGKISAKQANGNGGTIVVDGTAVKSKTSGTVTNSGTLNASATVAGGAGGTVSIKNMGGQTNFSGSIMAKGGQGGVGGKAEVSGAALSFAGTVDLTSPGGRTGNLLLDPATLTVISGGTGTVVSGENDSTSTSISPATVEAALSTTNLVLNANTNITISDAITWTSANTLTLSTKTSGSTIDINAPISGVNGTLAINSAASTDFVGTGSAGAINVATFILLSGSWNQESSSLPAFTAGTSFQLEGQSTFTRIEGFDSAHGGALEIADIYGLEGLGSPSGNNLGVPAELMNNIDATSTATWNSGAGFVPIGFYDYSSSSDANTYSGTFNGAGYTINGLTINRLSDNAGVGLFGDTAGTSTIENLSLTKVSIEGSTYVGGLAGVCNATVQDVDVSGAVSGISYVGGIMGISSGAISNSYTTASVEGSISTGGLDGYQQFGTISDCYSSGLLLTGGGGLVGSSTGTVTNSFWDTTTSGTGTSAGGTGETTATLLLESTYSSVGWNIGTNQISNTWVIFNGQTRPLLGIEYSPTITNAHQLQLIGLNSTTLEGSYTLANNIDLSSVTNPADIWGTSTTNGGGGFVPLGTGTSGYDGTFNGQGYVVNDLYINTPNTGYVALFGGVASGTVENVGVTNLDVVGSYDTAGLVGATIGSGSTITNDYTTGSVTCTYLESVGGLVGANYGPINNCYSTASVTATTSTNFVGGLVGYDVGPITNSYSTGAVTAAAGSTQVGGLVGVLASSSAISNSYSAGLVSVGTDSSEVGAFAGQVDGTVNNSFWDSTTAGVSVGVGGGSSSGITSATTTQLESQSFILANAPTAPTWNFSSVWTTNGGTTTPQLIGLGSSMAQNDTLSGTAFSDGGSTASSGVTVDLIFDGSLLGSTTTSGSGAFSFSISATDLTSGILLTDATDNGNTYYQANTPASSIVGIDIYGSTLRVVADTASNTALGLVAMGSGTFTLSGAGINYARYGTNLSTNSGVNMSILSNYTLDGNITASGTLSTGSGANLNGTANVTLTGTSVALAGTFNRAGSLAVTSTDGEVSFNNVGALNTPATANGITVNSAGPIILSNSYLATGGGNFTATDGGAGSDLNGIDMENSVIDSQGGSISLTGQASYAFSNGQNGNLAGVGVLVDNSVVETAAATESETTGNITIDGNGSVGTVQAPVTVLNNLIGVDLTHSVTRAVNGAISITGDVNSGTATAVLTNGSSSLLSGRVFGIIANNGNVITAVGTGSVTMNADSTGSTASLTNEGVDLSGLDPSTTTISNAFVSAAGGSSGVTVTGSAGAIANSPVTVNSDIPVTAGISIDYGANVTASGSAPITLNGTGGNDLNTSGAGLDDERSYGIFVVGDNNGNLGNSASVAITSGGGNISLQGTAGGSIGTVEGVAVLSSDGNTASIGSATGNISIIGFTPNEGQLIQSVSSSDNGDMAGVNIEGKVSSGSLTSVSASAGSIFIEGEANSGTDNSREAGIIIHGDANVTASGTGGTAGATAQGDVTLIGDNIGSTAQTLNGGVFIYGPSVVVSASGLVADSHQDTGLTIRGTATGIDGSSDSVVDGTTLQPASLGIGIVDGATAESLGAAPTTLNGTGGTNANTLNNGNGYADPTTEATSGSYGVTVFSPISGQTTTLSSGGNLHITGTAGSSPTSGFGVLVGGSGNAGAANVMSVGGSITIVGTGGSGNPEDVGTLPNAGVGIFDPGDLVNNVGGTASVSAQGGDLNITGTAGAGGLTGVYMQPYFLGSYNNAFVATLNTSANASITAVSGEINSNAVINAGLGISFSTPTSTSSPITAFQYSFVPVSLSGGDYVFEDIYNPVNFASANVTSLTITEGTHNPPNDTDLGNITTGSLTVTTYGNININGAINATGPVTMQNTQGNITFGANGSITDSGQGDVILAAGTDLANSHYIINNSNLDRSTIETSGGNFYLYSADPTNDSFGNISVPAENMIYNATFATTGLPPGNEELFYVSGPGAVGPNGPGGNSGGSGSSTGSGNNSGSMTPSTLTGGAAGAGSTIVPPALVPQPVQISQPGNPVLTTTGGSDGSGVGSSTPPPFNFAGTGISEVLGQEDGGLANSASNSAQVGTGDAAQLNGGQLNSVANPQAADALNEALGPIVYANLADALKDIGDWADVPDSSNDTTGDNGGGGETILSGGDVAEVTASKVKNIPLSQAPAELQKAMKVDVLNGVGH